MSKKECGCYPAEWSADDNVMFPGHTCDVCMEKEIMERNMVIVCTYNEKALEPLEQYDEIDDLPW